MARLISLGFRRSCVTALALLLGGACSGEKLNGLFTPETPDASPPVDNTDASTPRGGETGGNSAHDPNTDHGGEAGSFASVDGGAGGALSLPEAGAGGDAPDTGTGGAPDESGGASQGGAAQAGHAGANTGGVSGSDNHPTVPEDLEVFVEGVHTAAEEAQAQGSHNCATALPVVRVSSDEDALEEVREHIARIDGVASKTLREEVSVCNLPSTAKCANLFQNDVYHSDGRMGNKLYPLAKQVDNEAKGVRVIIFTAKKAGTAVVTVGIKDGYLMGIAYFQDRETCE